MGARRPGRVAERDDERDPERSHQHQHQPNHVDRFTAGTTHRQPIGGVAYGNGRWLALSQSGTVFRSSDGTTWSKRGQAPQPVSDLAFGGGATSTTAPTTLPEGPATTGTIPPATVAPTTVAPPPAAKGIEGVDFRNYTYQDRTCDNAHPPVHLTDGKYEVVNGFSNPPGTPYCGMSIDNVEFADVTGDGVPDAIVTGSAFVANLQPWTLVWTSVFVATPTGPKNLGTFDGTAYPPYSASGGIRLWSGQVGTVQCCAATYQETTYRYSDATGTLTQVARTIVPPSEAPTAIVTYSGR